MLEATDGYELLDVAALAAAAAPVAVVSTRQVRDFAKATGQLAKTNRRDADLLARFADVVGPAVRPIADDAARELEALLTRRRPLRETLQAERHRTGQVFGKGKRLVVGPAWAGALANAARRSARPRPSLTARVRHAGRRRATESRLRDRARAALRAGRARHWARLTVHCRATS